MMTAILASWMLIAAGERPAAAAGANSTDKGWREDRNCGPNALYVLLFMCGKKPEYHALLSRFALTERGASVADVARVAGESGVPLVPLRAKASALGSFPMPAIVHCHNPDRDGGHYLVLLAVNEDDTFTVLGPITGKMQRLSQGDFYDQWTGVILVRSDRWNDNRLDWFLLVSSGALAMLFVGVCVWRRRQASAG
jgi:ATP-binding cassette subfamily B protein RaxB